MRRQIGEPHPRGPDELAARHDPYGGAGKTVLLHKRRGNRLETVGVR